MRKELSFISPGPLRCFSESVRCRAGGVQGRIGDERQVAPHACRISDPFEQCGHAEANGLDLCVRPSVSLSLFRFHVDGRRK